MSVGMISTLMRLEAEGIFRNVILQDKLVLKLRGLRDDQILPVGGEFGFGAGDVKWRHGADFELLFVVVIKFFGNGHGLLFRR